MLQAWNPSWNQRRIDASALADGAGFTLGGRVSNPHGSASPVDGVSVVVGRTSTGELLIEALGPTPQIAAYPGWQGLEVIDRRGCTLIPGLVNAHTHLDLTHIGPRPYDPLGSGGFTDWIGMIRKERRGDSSGIHESVTQGVDLGLKGGTVLIGDIAGAVGGMASPEAGRALAGTGRLNAVTFMEFFAIGHKADKATGSAAWNAKALMEELAALPGPRMVSGLQPHAIYSVYPTLYAKATASIPDDMPVCTHLAESMAEHLLVHDAKGPLVDFLRSLHVWDDDSDDDPPSGFGRSESPTTILISMLSERPMTAVHVNDATDDDITNLEAAGWPVVYCPRASAYFAAERDFGPHRYRDMLAAGIPVALGTDSIVNLDRSDRISVWDEMVFLHKRDRADPVTLLKMATLHGATALRRDSEAFTFREGGPIAGLVAVPGSNLAAALKAGGDPELLAIGRV